MKIKEIANWASTDTVTITVTQEVNGLAYPLRVRRFVPEEHDKLQREWKTRGVAKHYECSNYAIENMRQTCKDFCNFVDGSIEESINYYIDESDWLLHRTYHMAFSYSAQPNVSDLDHHINGIFLNFIG